MEKLYFGTIWKWFPSFGKAKNQQCEKTKTYIQIIPKETYPKKKKKKSLCKR